MERSAVGMTKAGWAGRVGIWAFQREFSFCFEAVS